MLRGKVLQLHHGDGFTVDLCRLYETHPSVRCVHVLVLVQIVQVVLKHLLPVLTL